jgi:very-short-patch-repair endonuclease
MEEKDISKKIQKSLDKYKKEAKELREKVTTQEEQHHDLKRQSVLNEKETLKKYEKEKTQLDYFKNANK